MSNPTAGNSALIQRTLARKLKLNCNFHSRHNDRKCKDKRTVSHYSSTIFGQQKVCRNDNHKIVRYLLQQNNIEKNDHVQQVVITNSTQLFLALNQSGSTGRKGLSIYRVIHAQFASRILMRIKPR